MNPWPAILFLVLNCLDLGLIMANHGKPRGPSNAWISVAALATNVAILAWGGFFRPLFGG